MLGPIEIACGCASIIFGDVPTTWTDITPIYRTTYTEPTSGAKRSLASSSSSDTSSGTGARTVEITYFKADYSGPYVETVTLNGTTGVNTTATDICYIEKMVVTTVGSSAVNLGTITLYSATNKGGTIIGTIGATDNSTYWLHHYIPSNKICKISSISCGSLYGNGGGFRLYKKQLNVSNAAPIQISETIQTFSSTPTLVRDYSSPIQVEGPAIIGMAVMPKDISSAWHRAAIEIYEY